MEKDSPSKPSVAELAGRFRGQTPPTSHEQPSFRRRPPCSLKLPQQKDHNEDSPKTISPSAPLKVRTRNSALIEKLQANLVLSPTALLPSPKSPDVKLQPTPLSPSSPQSLRPQSPPTPLSPSLSPPTPLSPSLRPASSEEEEPVGFETPAEGTTLPSINKTRARLSFKRRPPTRQHRRSAGEEPASPPPDPPSPGENGLCPQLCHAQDRAEGEEPQPMDRDCDTIEEEARRSRAEDSGVSEEQRLTSELCVDADDEEESEEKMEIREGADQDESE